MVYIVLNYVIIYSTKNVTEDNYLRMTQKHWELGGSVWKKINQTGDEKINKVNEKFAIIMNKSVLACQYKFPVILYRLTGWLQKCIKTITIPRSRLIIMFCGHGHEQNSQPYSQPLLSTTTLNSLNSSAWWRWPYIIWLSLYFKFLFGYTIPYSIVFKLSICF